MLSRNGRLCGHLTIAAICVLAVAGAAHAQSPLGIGSAEPSFALGGPFAPLMQWINVHQQMFYRALTGALKAMREDNWAMASLVGLSFAYGVFHAAGPGHGKAVISSYMIANETQSNAAFSFPSFQHSFRAQWPLASLSQPGSCCAAPPSP